MDRKAVNDWLNRARHAREEVGKEDDLIFKTDRIFFTSFYLMCSAISLAENVISTRHRMVVGQFKRLFIETGIFTEESVCHFLEKVWKLRTIAIYEEVAVDETDYAEVWDAFPEFFEMLTTYIESAV